MGEHQAQERGGRARGPDKEERILEIGRGRDRAGELRRRTIHACHSLLPSRVPSSCATPPAPAVKAWISKALSSPSSVIKSDATPRTVAAAMAGWLQYSGGTFFQSRNGGRSCMPHSPSSANTPYRPR